LGLEDEASVALLRALRDLATSAVARAAVPQHEGPSDSEARRLYGEGIEAAKEYGDHLERGIALLRDANTREPNDPLVMSALGAALSQEWDSADALLDTAASTRGSSIVRADRVRFAVWRRDPAKLAAAVADLEAHASDPGLRVAVRLVLPLSKALAAAEKVAA